MISTHHLKYVALALLVLLAAWLIDSGHWRTLAARVPGLAQDRPDRLLADAGEEAATAGGSTTDIRSWRDAEGSVHFGDGSAAPAGSDMHQLGKTTTLADHIETLEDSDVSMEALYRKQQERLKQEAQQVPADSGNPMLDATQQARELQQRQRDAMDAIRAENNR